MEPRIKFAGWVRLATLCAVAITVIAVAPTAGAAAGAAAHVAHHRKHHRRHHRHHHRAVTAKASLEGCQWADVPATAAPSWEMRAAVVCLVNQQRNERGLPSLGVSAKLNRSAQGWNEWMVATGNFTHGANFASRISAVGYDWQEAGENIATGFGTPREVVAAWMASKDHCQNILDPGFRDVGTGVTPSADGNWSNQPSTWTQDFGLLMSQNPASHNTGPQAGCPY